MQFGALRYIKTRHGDKSVGEWALHIQTSWKFVRDAEIVVAVGDLYLRPDGESYDWDDGGDSNFDLQAYELNNTFSSASVVVQRVDCDDVGSFSLAFSDSFRFDVFPKISDSIDDVEHWRLFQPDSDGYHFVCQTRSRGQNAG